MVLTDERCGEKNGCPDGRGFFQCGPKKEHEGGKRGNINGRKDAAAATAAETVRKRGIWDGGKSGRKCGMTTIGNDHPLGKPPRERREVEKTEGMSKGTSNGHRY